MKLNNKVAIVTGSTKGIGKGIAMKFASEGAALVICSRNLDEACQVADNIRNQGRKAIALKTDVSIKEDVQNLIKKTLEEFKAIHILVNNAGTTRHRPLLEMTEGDWDFVLNNDLKSTFFCTQAVMGHMMKQRYGKIINISSSSGIERTSARETMANYAAAKAGIIQLTKVAAKVGGPFGINVNAIAPGLIETELMYVSQTKEAVEKLIETKKKASVLNRIGTSEDVANLALFLASDESSFITAQVICCDGGTTDRL